MSGFGGGLLKLLLVQTMQNMVVCAVRLNEQSHSSRIRVLDGSPSKHTGQAIGAEISCLNLKNFTVLVIGHVFSQL